MSRTHHVHTQRRATVQKRSRIGAPRRFPPCPLCFFARYLYIQDGRGGVFSSAITIETTSLCTSLSGLILCWRGRPHTCPTPASLPRGRALRGRARGRNSLLTTRRRPGKPII